MLIVDSYTLDQINLIRKINLLAVLIKYISF